MTRSTGSSHGLLRKKLRRRERFVTRLWLEPLEGRQLMASDFQIAGLLTTGVTAIEHGGVTGDDRGGIALTGDQMLVTGDSRTGRFSESDLTGGTALSRVLDS